MKLTLAKASKCAFAIGVIAVAAIAADSLGGPVKPGSGCPRRGIYCLDVWNPVDCIGLDGQVHTYSNSCYAYVACATGCVAGGTQ